MPFCNKCHQEIYWDDERVGKNGRLIPLDPTTHEPHDCPMKNNSTSPQGELNQATLEKITASFREELQKEVEGMRSRIGEIEDLLISQDGKVPLERLRELEKRVSTLELKE